MADTHPRPAELEDRLDEITERGPDPAAPPGGSHVSTNPNDTPAEHEPMAIADSDHQNEPGEQMGGGQTGG